MIIRLPFNEQPRRLIFKRGMMMSSRVEMAKATRTYDWPIFQIERSRSFSAVQVHITHFGQVRVFGINV